MARTNAASASFQTQNLRGFAHSLHRPVLQRLLTAEPLLRRAVPILIVAFIAAVAVGAVVQITNHRQETIDDAGKELALLSLLLGEDLTRRAGDDTAAAKAQATLREALPTLAIARGRRLYITEAGGRILATAPEGKFPATLIDVLGPGQALTVLAERAGVMEVALADGTLALVTVRTLAAPFGQIALLQPRDTVLERWRGNSALTITLVTTTGFVLLILGFAFHWQSTRAREADTDLRDGARAHRHRAQSRALRTVGLGSGTRPHLLVGFHVRDSRLRAARGASVVRRSRRAGAPRRRASL